MAPHTAADESEIRETWGRYVALRNRIDRGEATWDGLGEFFVDDATFIDPAWGRVEGLENITEFFTESMVGLEAWSFPEAWTMVDGNRVVTMWWQVMGSRDDATTIRVPGISILYYAGDGKFCYEQDIMNMAHVMEAITESGWAPSGDFNMPPSTPNRDVSLPPQYAHLAGPGDF